MTPLWIFSLSISSYFRTLTGNLLPLLNPWLIVEITEMSVQPCMEWVPIKHIFLEVCFVEAKNSRLQACSVREEEKVLQGFLGVFDVLEHPLLCEYFLKNGGFSPAVGCRLQSCNFIKWEMRIIYWIFPQIFGAVTSKYCHENLWWSLIEFWAVDHTPNVLIKKWLHQRQFFPLFCHKL